MITYSSKIINLPVVGTHFKKWANLYPLYEGIKEAEVPENENFILIEVNWKGAFAAGAGGYPLLLGDYEA